MNSPSSCAQAPAPASAPAPQRRARVACQACNARRVKCDVADVHPCWHCRVRQTSCVLIESRRGKYERKKKRALSQDNATSSSTSSLPNDSGVSPAIGDSTQSLQDNASVPTVSEWHDEVTHRDPAENVQPEGVQGHDHPEGPEMLYARIAESEPAHHRRGSQIQPQGRSYYLGESFSLAYIVRTVCSPTGGEADGVYRVHYPIPPTVADRPTETSSRPPILCAGETAASRNECTFTPPRHVADKLVRIFFETTHAAWPVFDRRDFTTLYNRGHVSLLVLQTIFFLGLTVCPDDLVREAGFTDRADARRTYYLRAKALYDADYETDRVNLAAVLFLLGFWWAGPEDQKDTWHWLGSAISLAQTLGMHRSTAQSGMTPRHRSLWKRIWWSIYTRDRHASASLGRPCRIHDEDCDVEMLTVEDFYADEGYDELLVSRQEDFHVQYAIEMSKLAIILGKILSGEFSPRRRLVASYDAQQLGEELARWESQLPPVLQQRPLDGGIGAPFWSRMLYANYCNCEILLYRPRTVEPLTPGDIDRDNKARVAADFMTRIAEDLLTARTLQYGQLHLVPAIFAALSIHAVVIRRKDPILRQLAENRSRQCMLAMSELSKLWPVGGWILQLFVHLMRRLTGPVPTSENSSNTTTSRASSKARHNVAAPFDKPSINNVDVALGMPEYNPGYHSAIPTPPNSLDVREREIDSPRGNYPQALAQDQQHFPYMPLGADQLLSDAIWAGNMDAGFDMEFLLQSNSAPFLSNPFNGISMTEESYSEVLPGQDSFMSR